MTRDQLRFKQRASVQGGTVDPKRSVIHRTRATATSSGKDGQSISGLAGFLARYKTFDVGQADRELADFRSRFPDVRAGIQRAIDENIRNEKDQAPRVNLLKLLDHQFHEWVHTKILKDLLDPKGTHGQGTLFLNEFLRSLRRPDLATIVTANPQRVWVDEEVGTHLGRLDILVRLPPHFVAILENKVRAKEGKDQLERYRKLLDQQPEKEKLLIYLTSDRRKSETKVRRYVRFSYAVGIYDWIARCKCDIAPRLQLFLDQYLEVIRTFATEEVEL